MDWKTAVTVFVSVSLALAGYFATYLNGLRLARRKDRLDRIDRQLSDLYGPLLALASTGTSAWQAFTSRYRRGAGRYYWSDQNPPSAEEADAWRLWMREVFMPNNERIVDVVTRHADLLIEAEMPQVLLDVCAHVAAYRPVIMNWEHDDFADNSKAANTSTINFPSAALLSYASQSFVRLKHEQNTLLGEAGRKQR